MSGMLALLPVVAATVAATAIDDWPSYNRDLASNRFSAAGGHR